MQRAQAHANNIALLKCRLTNNHSGFIISLITVAISIILMLLV